MIDYRSVDPDLWQAAVTARRRTVRCRVSLVNLDNVAVGASVKVADGAIRFTGESSEQWTADFTVSDPLMVPLSPDDPLDPRAGLRVRIWWELLTTLGWVSVPCGACVLHDPDISDTGVLSMSLEGTDLITEIRRGGYGGQTISVGGLTVPDALGLLFDQVAAAYPRRVGASTVTLPSVYELGAREPFEDWTEIAAMAGWVVRADRDGIITCGPPPSDDTIRATWQEGADNRAASVRRKITTSEMVNRVTVVSTSAEVTPPIVSVVEDDDESSPTWVGLGMIWEQRIESDAVATQDGADNLAALTYGRMRWPTETVEVQVPPRPDLGYRDVVQIGRRRVGATGAYRVSSWDLDLKGGVSTVRTMSRSMEL